MPIVIEQCDKTRSGGDPEMIESCLQAFESFVLRSPREVAAFQQSICQISLGYLSYDPNYANDDGTEDEEMDDDNNEAEEDEDDADYSDDDDNSWKVRSEAADGCLTVLHTNAIVTCSSPPLSLMAEC